MGYWDDFPKSGPRRKAKDGIATRKARGEIGDTWWSKRFLAVLESFGHGSRLARGRSYARTGQVMDLRIGPGEITAAVQGSRAKPYAVRLAVVPLTPAQWAAVDTALAAQALFAAKLLAGEMPPEIEAVFAAAGQSLFPAKKNDLRTSCSCPDAANPCKHVAATCYILAERFDEDPFAMLHWRGRDREALMGAVRALRTAEAEPVEVEVEAEPEPIPLAGFWDAGPDALALKFRPGTDGIPEAPARVGALSSGGVDLVEALGPRWVAIAKAAGERGGS